MTVLRRIGTLLLAPVLAVLIAVAISAVVMALLGVDPLRVLSWSTSATPRASRSPRSWRS
jgi:ABC-type uncharacterized transport system permease subunit